MTSNVFRWVLNKALYASYIRNKNSQGRVEEGVGFDVGDYVNLVGRWRSIIVSNHLRVLRKVPVEQGGDTRVGVEQERKVVGSSIEKDGGGLSRKRLREY